jgi:hypothetical protein
VIFNRGSSHSGSPFIAVTYQFAHCIFMQRRTTKGNDQEQRYQWENNND